MEEKQLKKVNNQLIAQSRRLVEARYSFGLWELRLYLKMVEMVQKDDKDFRNYRIYFKDLIEDYGGNSGRDYQLIKKSATRLLKKFVTLEYVENGKEVIVQTHLLSSAKHPKNWKDDDDNAYLDLSFDPHLKPYLLNLKGNFLLYDRQNILKLQSKFAVRIYQILKSHERKETDNVVVEYKVQKLREMLLVDDEGKPTKEYSKYYMFKKRVLLQSQKELEKHTDIAFSFDEIKKGRRVDMIRFYLRKNRKKKTPTNPIQEVRQLEIEQSETLQALIKVGIGIDKASSLIETLGEEVAMNELKHAKKALKGSYNVKSETGFIISMMKKQPYTKAQAIEKAKQEAKKRKAKQQQAQIALQKKQIAGLRKEYTTERNKAVKLFLKDLDKDQVAELVEKHAKKKPFVYKAIKQAEKKGNTKEANDFKYGLFTKELTDEDLHSFEKYIAGVYGFKLKEVGSNQFLVAID